MIKIRKFKKYVALSATALIFGITGMVGVVSAANTKDESFSFAVSQNDSGYSSTHYRLKYNNSAVYIKTAGTTVSSFVVQVYGAKNNQGLDEKNCGAKYPSRVVYPNKTYYYATTIDGSTYTHAKLRVAGHSGYGQAKGSWSPDNSGNYTNDR